MRGMVSRSHIPGVYLYHGKNGKIEINDKNREEIRSDAEELSKEIFNSKWICPQARFKPEIKKAKMNLMKDKLKKEIEEKLDKLF